MSRFYNLQIGERTYDGSGPNALQVELNISQATAGVTNVGSMVRVWGIPLSDISQSNNLYGKQVVVRAGMRAGLPLANPGQAGVLGGGMVSRAFGNWVGTEQTLDVIFNGTTPAASTGGQDMKTPTANLVLNWKKGKPLNDALQQALQTAYPGFKIAMNIAGNFTAPSDQVGFHGNIDQFSYYLRRFTQQLGGAGSQGVGLTIKNGTITASDGQQSGSKTINYVDLVGQPTWIDSNTISIKLVMRGDLNVLDMITLPTTLVTTQGQFAGASGGPGGGPNSSLTFQGTFQIRSINHIGNSRQPSAEAWVTVVEAWLPK